MFDAALTTARAAVTVGDAINVARFGVPAFAALGASGTNRLDTLTKSPFRVMCPTNRPSKTAIASSVCSQITVCRPL